MLFQICAKEADKFRRKILGFRVFYLYKVMGSEI